MKKRIVTIYGVLLTIGGLYYAISRLTGWRIPCFYRATTGLLCPGCGTTKLFMSLAAGDIAQAFWANPVMFVLLIVWNIFAAVCFFGAVSPKTAARIAYILLAVSVVSLLCFTVIRNCC